MRICPACGEENPGRARFCLACGTPLEAAVPALREERKVVTVLFADLVGFTSKAERLDPEDVRALLAPFYALLRTELERYGGTIEQFTGDGVLALFGVPLAHEDDPERAVRAALAIREAIVESNEADPDRELNLRIAVNTGEVLVGLSPGSESERMVAGDVVNTGQRLQAAAPVNGILVGESTYRATARAIEYRAVDPVRAKGKAEPVLAWEALVTRARLGVDTRHSPRVDLVGRDRELDLLVGALDGARTQREPQLVTLVGPPGIGKTRLVYELSRAAQADPEIMHWRQGRCLPYGEGASYWALGEIVKAQAGILETDSADEAAQKVRRAVEDRLDEEAVWVEAHLYPLVGLAADADFAGDRRKEAFAAWRRFFEALAEERPVILVFEDLQWADEGLLDFVDHLVDWVRGVPLLVVCTARPDLFERRADWGGGKRNATTVSLAPLSEEETAALVAALLEEPLLPADVQRPLVVRAGGNPLYMEEYVRMLQERGLLHRDERGWQLDPIGDLPLPESVQGIIASRVDALPPEEKALLQDAAVVGKVFWAGALMALADAPRATQDELLVSLERRDFIRHERRPSVAGEAEYAFRHRLVREIAYAQIPRVRRAEKHRLAAEWVEGLTAGREDHAEMRAHHFLDALQFAPDREQLAGRARVAFREAADQAAGLSDFPRAARFYEEALVLWPRDDPERPRLLLDYGRALFLHEERGEEVLLEARDGLLAVGDSVCAAEAEVTLALLDFAQGRRDEAFALAERAAGFVADAPASSSKGYVLSTLASLQLVGDRTDDAVEVGGRALAIAEELGLDELRARALRIVGAARAARGDSGGLEDLERAIALADRLNSLEQIPAYVNLAATHIAFGDLPRAFELQEEARHATERFADRPRARWLRGEQVLEYYWCGRWDEAIEVADELLADGGTGYVECFTRLYRAQIRLGRGELEAALDDAAASLDTARTAKDSQLFYPALAIRARALAASGRFGEAGALTDELLAVVTGEESFLGPFWADLAVVLSELGRGEELLEAAQRVRAPTRWVDAAEAYASESFAFAAELYAEIGSLPDEAFARLRAAERMRADRADDARQQLRRALDFYRRAGAAGYLPKGDALSAASG